MTFIEQWLGVSPDGGSGALEVTLTIGVLALIASLVFRYGRPLRRTT